MATGLGLQLAADYGTIDKDTPSYDPISGLIDYTLIDGKKFLTNKEGDPVAIVIGSHESNYTQPFEVTSKMSIEVGLPQPVVQTFTRKFWLAVALAPYRKVDVFGGQGVDFDTVCPGRTANYAGNSTKWHLANNITGQDVTDPDKMNTNSNYISSQTTQVHMDDCWEPTPNAHWVGSTQATTSLINATGLQNLANNTIKAAHAARTIKIYQNGGSEVGMDLPTIDCLMRIYQARQYIDSNDPTLKIFGNTKYKNWTLTQWLFPYTNNGQETPRYPHAISSTPIGLWQNGSYNNNRGRHSYVYAVMNNGRVMLSDPNNALYYDSSNESSSYNQFVCNRGNPSGIIPVLEIPVV